MFFFSDSEVAPGADVQSREAIEEFIRNYADTAYHHSCTCRMGPESKALDDDSHEASVVRPDGKVIGVQGLRVVDSSIFPSMVSASKVFLWNYTLMEVYLSLKSSAEMSSSSADFHASVFR